jgi:glycerophosphoryl diester phosphodiesterase
LYFSKSSGPDAYFGLEDYFQLDGMAYRLVPIKTNSRRIDFDGKVNTTTLPDNLLNVFPYHARVDVINNPGREQKPEAPYLWGGINDKRVYHPEETARMYGTIKSIYWRTATQLAEEGNVEKAEQVLDKLSEIFNPEVTPLILVGNYNHSIFSIFHIDAYLKLETPTANEKAEKMIARMLDEFIETFNWFNSCNDRTLVIQSENINLCVRYLSTLLNFLSDEQRLLFKDKFEQLNITKAITSHASQIIAEIDIYIKRGGEAQRQLFEKMNELVSLIEIADLVNDQVLEDNITRILDQKINMISAIDPQGGRMFREYFFPEKTEVVVGD